MKIVASTEKIMKHKSIVTKHFMRKIGQIVKKNIFLLGFFV